jgi:hypothetical protein
LRASHKNKTGQPTAELDALLSRWQRPHAPVFERRKRPQIGGYSSETGKRRFALDCVVVPRGLYRLSTVNRLRESGTSKRSMTFQGFLGRLSHFSVSSGRKDGLGHGG